jgi:enoyl-[acyl-carrier-protein] reductase (NADH)
LFGRLVRSSEAAHAIAFLASDLAAAITGVTLPVDCGFVVAGSWPAYGGLRRP